MTDHPVCDDPFHDARTRDDTTNKARRPCPTCGGTWVDFGHGPVEVVRLDEGALDTGIIEPEPVNHADAHEVYGLVMPFVVVKSKGGPLDDDAYVSGFECGRLDVRLAECEGPRVMTTVHTVSIPQLDLIAMSHGWRMTAEPTEHYEWTFVEFEKP